MLLKDRAWNIGLESVRDMERSGFRLFWVGERDGSGSIRSIKEVGKRKGDIRGD